MNPEFKLQSENIETDIDFHIEALKKDHPFITKEEYWSALKKFKIDYEKLKKLIAPLLAVEINDFDSNNQNNLEVRGDARFNLAIAMLDCSKNIRPLIKAIIESMNDSTYFFMPEYRPQFAEANPIFGAEKYGIPELMPAVLVLSKESWKKAFDFRLHFDEINEELYCPYRGFCIQKEEFGDGNIFSTLGFNLIDGNERKSVAMANARHESIHAVDFLKQRRKGADQIISELITYRIDGKMTRPRNNKEGKNPLDDFLKHYLEMYTDNWGVDIKIVEQAVNKLEKSIIKVEKVFGFSVVTELLLNSESIYEFINMAENELNKKDNDSEI